MDSRGDLFDQLENPDYTLVIDNLATLLSELKNKNENMNISISKLVPSLQRDTLQTKIRDFNELLVKWGAENGISIIDPDPVFRIRSGDIDEACYQAYGQHQGSLLNRLGAT